MDSDGCIGVMLVGIIFVLGAGFGSSIKNRQWRNNLVDRTDYIAVIKSEVIAERSSAQAYNSCEK